MATRVITPIEAYGIATLTILGAVGLRLLMDPLLGTRFPFATLFIAVLVTAWVGGFGPAAYASLLGAVVSARVLLPPRESLEIKGLDNQAGMALYLGVSLGIALIGQAMRGARLQAQTLAREADERRQQVEAALIAVARLEEQFRVTLICIGDAVISTDTRGCVTFLNPVAEQLTGWSGEEAVGKPLSEVFRIVNESGETLHEIPTMRALREGKVVGPANHTLLIHRDGIRRPIDDSAAPVQDRQGRTIGAVLVFRDISEQRRIKAALVASEQRARERAEELEQVLSELRQAAAALTDADRRKDEFLATLAHELRNPLAPLQNALEIMKLAADDQTAVERSRNTAERQLAQMVRLIDDLLDVSRISQGKLELRTEHVDVAAAIESAVETIQPQVTQHGHRLAVAMPAEPLWINADVTRLAQVFANLLSNSVKYSDPGADIRVVAEQQADEAVIQVSDTGIGIPPAMLPRIFEMFIQVDGSLEKSRGGLGVGLTLVKRLIELHGGTVMASSPGVRQGSTFTVRLPVARPVESQRPSEPPPPSAQRPVSSVRVLVVDDNRDSADTLGMMLQLLGYDVVKAHDGEQAVALADSARPEVVLLDIGLPKLNGLEACRRIRSAPWGKSLYLVALTGWGQDADIRRSREAGFDEHLVKPVSLELLLPLLAKRGV